MGENTAIEWAHHSFNCWVGCTKVGPPCDHCYAEAWAKRTGHPELWEGERRRTSADNWQQPLKWDRAAAAAGERHRVFCASLADVFDNQAPTRWRDDLWHLIEQTPHLDWLLLTKRAQNIRRMLPNPHTGVRPWGDGWPNVWLGITCGDQNEFDRDWPKLAAIEASVRFISYEPALGPLRLWESGGEVPLRLPFPDWIIAGGESGSKDARPPHPQWFREVRDDCAHLGIAFLFKQWGAFGCVADLGFGGRERCKTVTLHDPYSTAMIRVGKDVAGRHLDGIEHNGFPVPREEKRSAA